METNPSPAPQEAPVSPGVSARFAATPFVRRKAINERIAQVIFGAMAVAMIIPLLLIVGHLFKEAWPLLSWDFLTENPANRMREGGVWAPFIGTLYLVVIALCVSVPIGVLAAIYLNEYAKDNWITRIINLAVVNLAGVPSIVHALFGLGAFVLFARSAIFQPLDIKWDRNIVAAALTLGIMTLPVVIASTREALAAVPRPFREACWNVGATRWQTIRRIVLPNSVSGILTGVILQVSRAAGETAPIMFTGATMYKAIQEGSLFPYKLTDQCMALPYHLYNVSTQVTDAPHALPYAIAVVLLLAILLVNGTSIALRMYLRSRKKW